MVELKNINKIFEDNGKSFQAVKDVNLQIDDGDIYGIIGFSGAGKSTLVRCINLLERPTTGKVEIDGSDLITLSPKELRLARKKIGMIFQHFNLMNSRTIFENVAYPLKGSKLKKAEIKKKVSELLELVDIADKENAYPTQLSGGQKQRVAIARALANDPKIILCDEATSAVDPQTTKSILALLKKLNKKLGITIVLITHEMAVVKEICNKVAIMSAGEVVEKGDVFSVFLNPTQTVTRNFIKSTSNLQKIDALIADHATISKLNPGEVIVRLSYVKKNTSEPLISTVSQKFKVRLNVIFADIEIIEDSPIGGTVAIISGSKDEIQAAINYLYQKEVGVEVLKDARTA